MSLETRAPGLAAYDELISALDKQIGAAREKKEVVYRLKEVGKLLKSFEEREKILSDFGVAPSVDIERAKRELRSIQESLLGEISSDNRSPEPPVEKVHVPGPVIPRPTLAPSDEKEMRRLLDHVIGKIDAPEKRSPEERWYFYEIWACQWRIIAERVGPEITGADAVMKAAFGKIRDAMKSAPKRLWFIKALDPNQKMDWATRLSECQSDVAELARKREEEAEAQAGADPTEEAIWTLISMVRAFTESHNAETERQLRHALRSAAKYQHLREEASEIVSPYKEILEEEFAFLWPKEYEEEPAIEKQKLSGREILARLVKRMKSKALIGACHGPFEQIYKGFPEHHKGDARVALELLAKEGIVRMKPSSYGVRVSLEPSHMATVDRLIEERLPLKIDALELWCASVDTA